MKQVTSVRAESKDMNTIAEYLKKNGRTWSFLMKQIAEAIRKTSKTITIIEFDNNANINVKERPKNALVH